MAELPEPELRFTGGSPDPGQRIVELPAPLPEMGDDFDWQQRDYESFRDAMLEELAVRFPERRRWAAADLEVVLVEVLAAALDQLSDMADRVAAEAYLETARRPQSVYRWLQFIGITPELMPWAGGGTLSREELLDLWRDKPHEMDRARRIGPGTIRTQRRMATLRDYAERLEEHPLVRRAHAARRWGGAWVVIWITVSLWNDKRLADRPARAGKDRIPAGLRDVVDAFHRTNELEPLRWDGVESFGDVLEKYVARFRMIGQEVLLTDIVPVGVDLAFCLRVGKHTFQSEVRREADRVLGRGPGGFFEPGRLRFGEDLHASDFYERLMALDGVEGVDLIVLKRVGSLHSNMARVGHVTVDPSEVAVCDNNPEQRWRGTRTIRLRGGRRG